MLLAAPPRFRSAPPAVGSEGDRCIELAAIAGIDLDDWQQDVIRLFLSTDQRGWWAASDATMIVPRQNGKGKILEALEIYWMLLCESDRLITHTAHRADTSKEHMLRMRRLFEDCPTLHKRLAPNGIRVSNGDESITLKDETRLIFKTRSKGSGRGFDGQKIVLDEAYYLFDLNAMLPTVSAQHNPQVVFASSSPVDGPESDVLRKICTDGRKGIDGMAYVEWSVPPESDLDDEANWWAANPSMGIRLSVEWTRKERRLMDDAGFGAERLSIWTETAEAAAVIPPDKWAAGARSGVGEDWLADPVSFGIEGNRENDWVTVVAAGHTAEGRIGLDVVRHTVGTDWLLDWAIQANETHKPEWWVFDPKSTTADLFQQKFTDAGLPVMACGFNERALPKATAGLLDDITNDRIAHLDNQFLNAAVAGAAQRTYGESWLWDRRAGTVISPLVAATLARAGLVTAPEPAPVPFLVRR